MRVCVIGAGYVGLVSATYLVSIVTQLRTC